MIYLTYLAAALGIGGAAWLAAGWRRDVGFIMFLAADLSWLTYGYLTGTWALLVNNFFFIFISLYGIYAYRKTKEVR
jgi:hypothetical protein